MLDAKTSRNADAVYPSQDLADHTALKPGRTGILLANLGTPDGYDYWSVRRYLSEFLSDRRVVDYPRWLWQPLLQLVILSKRPFASGRNYKSIWNHEKGESPLLTITRDQTDAIRAQMQARFGDQVMVDFCMRYGNPSTRSKVSEMTQAGCTRILFFPLYPQYAAATTATANDQFFRALMQERRQPSSRTVPPYFANSAYIDSLSDSVARVYAGKEQKPEILLCSYHGLPERLTRLGDPYFYHCHQTTRLLRERLGWAESQILSTFQSRFGAEEWLKPYTVVEVARLANEGVKRIAVCAPAFSADCIETLEEINGEIREAFIHAGGEEFTYIPCLNDDTAHIAALSGIIAENLKGWLD